jgi:hypothetical protein
MSSDEAVIGTAAQNTNAITAGNDDDDDSSIVNPDPDPSANPSVSNPGKNNGKKNGKQTRNQFWKENPWMRKGHTCDLCKGASLKGIEATLAYILLRNFRLAGKVLENATDRWHRPSSSLHEALITERSCI